MYMLFKIGGQSLWSLVGAVVVAIIAANTFTIMVVMIHKGLAGNFTSGVVWGFLAALGGYAALNIVSRRMFLAISLEVVSRLRRNMVGVIIETPLATIENIAESITDMAHATIKIFQVIGVVAYFSLTDTNVLWVAGLFVGVLFFLQYMPAQYAAKYVHRMRNASFALSKRFEQAVYGTRELIQNQRKRRFFVEAYLSQAVEDFRKVFLLNKTIDFIFSHWNDVLIFVCMGGLTFGLTQTGVVTTKLAKDVVLFTLVLKDPAISAVNLIGNIYIANLRMKAIHEMGIDLTHLHDGESSAGLAETESPFGQFSRISLEEITFAYRRRTDGFHLGPFSLDIQRGELLYIVGGNGSGKTTLIKILAGLYTPESGTILIDGQPLNPLHAQQYRDIFHVIFADFFLFDEFLIPNFNEWHQQQCIRLLEMFDLSEIVQIDERGKILNTQLSQGQRKRLALIGAILEDKPVYILDEWAADQDPSFKKIYYTQILPELQRQGKTLVVISHDDSYYTTAHRRITLVDGAIKEAVV
jgi:putative pyoverdin transport system ATP-binding/permease protein